MRLDAAEVNIGNAVDGSDWVWPRPGDEEEAFEMLLNAPTRGVYRSKAGYYNMLLGNGYMIGGAKMISGWFPEGVYFKADGVGKYKNHHQFPSLFLIISSNASMLDAEWNRFIMDLVLDHLLS